jgi:hypothetical protein
MNPTPSAPTGFVPMQTARMPRTRPRARSWAASMTIVLCMVPKPDSPIPMANWIGNDIK